MARHIGRDAAGEMLVVSYMLLPDSTTKALVTRPLKMHQNLQRALMSLVDTPEAQSTMNLAEVLARRTFADSGKPMFQILHEAKALEAISIDEVFMTPNGNASFPLRAILAEMGMLKRTAPTQDGFNPFTNNRVAEASEDAVARAKNLLIEAQMLADDADRKRREAYHMAPQLRPTDGPSTATEAPAAEVPRASVEETVATIVAAVTEADADGSDGQS